MNKLIRKAKAGVTLVELLVVILIVTILSVALLPLLKPYIEESKYAAEPIPVLANLQTRINLYQYEKDKLPGTASDTYGQTWTNETASGVTRYKPAKITYNSGTISDWATTDGNHLQSILGIDWQDLLGRRMQPTHFCYHVIKADGSSRYGYALGVFGDGTGLGKGTGYAVMTIVDTVSSNKVVATWSRYKPYSDTKVSFSTSVNPDEAANSTYCYVPPAAVAFADSNAGQQQGTPQGQGSTSAWGTLLSNLSKAGWDFLGRDN